MIYVLSKNKKNVTVLHLKNTIFTAVKNRSILHRRVIIINLPNLEFSLRKGAMSSMSSSLKLKVDNCIQIFHLGRYIIEYMVRNFVLRRRVSGAVKHNFLTNILRYTSPN